MTRIAIYGDSYACNVTWGDQEKMQNRKSWIDHLSDKYDVTNYGRPGTNLSFTHDLFLQHNMNYDINIVLVTHWGRLHLNQVNERYEYMPNLGHLEKMIDECSDPHELKILNAAREYFIYVEDEHEVKKFHRLMVDEIKSTNRSTVIIPCFSKNISIEGELGNVGMFDINLIDNKYYGLAIHAVDSKHCHLNDKNNLIFANKIKEHIQQRLGYDFIINIDDYVEPVGEPVEYNFIV